MRTLAFFDCPTGIAGDMCLGALVSAGVPLDYLQTHLERLKLPEAIELRQHTVRKNHLAATQIQVILPHDSDPAAASPPTRHLRDIEALIAAAALPPRVQAWSLEIFRRLAVAEAAIHGVEPEAVHFHEVGATDALVDIVGTCLGLDWLGVQEVYCAPLPMGRGTVRAAHGRLPVPAPAVLKLMEMAEVPIYNAGLSGELVTPTGAAIATTLATHFGDPPLMKLRRVGLGAGNRTLAIPNILRLWIGSALQEAPTSHGATGGQSPAPATDPGASSPVPSVGKPPAIPTPAAEARSGLESVTVLETQVDDLSPQAIGYLYDRLLTAGALDIFSQAVTMKKSRPGHLITVIATPSHADCCEQILLQETTTLGVRRHQQSRQRLRREVVSLETPLGPIRMKLAFAPGQTVPFKAHPEYEDCAAIARQHQIPWRVVHQQALCYWQQQSLY